ncbi:DNA/RNA non-specific endonuclease [Nocardiopsis sp. N85]|uniref:DNA/RNA non-specific endonuclease n=1 Tax=Nocardiopsis sp. N85 TaxID=3029400 RepID=UPI00237F9445|nr:DNA/RNA non-specific endonuclease [Nocardiopsis sp. N85]MDE3721234.1 DNA/RNA non-specific endonuclease [Nocardiopsis sp. N85]
MPASGGFEPTEPQSGVDPNLFTLIDPDTIPYPLTDVWSLNYAAETLRSGGEDIAGDAEDMRSTWSGLQAHYSAPESEDLFSKMDPVVTRGEDVESDLVTVAEALEDLAEAATTARRKLNTLKIQAQGFHNRNQDKAVWWLTKDDKTDEAAFLENIRLKDEVNTAWAAFNEAENACASKISAVYGGAAYVSPDQARGDDVIVYGLPTDAGERDTGFTTLFTESANDMAAWFDAEYWVSPAEVTFDNSTGQAAWDIIVTDVLWGSAVGLVSLSGAWHPDNGWRLDPAGRWDNLKKSGWDTVVGAGTLVGVHDDQGWLFSSEGGGASWGRWTDNMGDVLAEGWEGNTAWSQKDEDPEYTGATSGINLVLLTVGLPLKALKTGLTLGPGGDVDGDGSDRSDLGDEDRSSPTGGRPLSGESSPWPRDGDARTPTTGERFGHDLDILRESLLDPNRYRDTPDPQPDRPSSGGDGAPAPRNPNTDTPQGQGGTPAPDRPRGETSDAPRTPEAAAPRGGRSRDDTIDAPQINTRSESPYLSGDPSGDSGTAPDIETNEKKGGATRSSSTKALDHENLDDDGYSSIIPDSGDTPRNPSPGDTNGGDGGHGNGETPGSESPNQDPYSGSVNRPHHDHTKSIGKDSPLFPGNEQRFGTDGEGKEKKLEPNTLYEVEDRGVFITDSTGKISHVETQPGQDTKGNPELVYPRPKAKYYIDHPTSGAKFVYETDEKSRTISVEGELESGKTSRNSEQTPIGHEGKNYFEEYNESEEEYAYEKSTWQGGHFVAGNMFGGPGERINIVPMLRSLNHTGNSNSYHSNWARLEYLWHGLLTKEKKTLLRAYRTGYVESEPGNKDALARDWLDLAGPDPSITFSMKIVYDDTLTEHNRNEFREKYPPSSAGEKYDRNRPEKMDHLGAPPSEILVDWSLNEQEQETLVYDNHPPRESRNN